MEKEKTTLWPCVIIKEGVPYLLTKLTRKNVSDPCEMCDLRQPCYSGSSAPQLIELCRADDRDDSWYFERNWEICDKHVSDFVIEDEMIRSLMDS